MSLLKEKSPEENLLFPVKMDASCKLNLVTDFPELFLNSKNK